MKIKVLSSCAGIDFCFQPGQIVDAKTEFAKDLIGGGLAEEIKTQAATKSKSEPKAKTEPKVKDSGEQEAGVKTDADTK